MRFGEAASRLFARPLSTAPRVSSLESWAGCLDASGLAASVPSDLTHAVGNQSQPLSDYNAFEIDPTLHEGLRAAQGEWAVPHVSAFGAQVGASAWQAHADAANKHPPKLISHDRFGRRIDVVEYHPSYHELMRLAIEEGATHSFAWDPAHADRPGALVARCTLMYLMYTLEQGVCCPATMTFAATPAMLAAEAPSVAGTWLPLLAARAYDPRDVPVTDKSGATVRMSMTEKQGVYP